VPVAGTEPVVTLDTIAGVVGSALLLVYLVYAMLRPEKF
jgi:K+-transporting ATPase KdpF subunit